ncbi:MAG: AI-2E family transporter [Nitrospinae bacterium]|nr:AI-2E family transporter [Nitrospinota bacterium]
MNKEEKELDSQRFYFLLFLIVFSIYLCWQLFSPFLEAIILAACIASIFSPLYLMLEKKLPGRKVLNSTLSSIAVVLIVILPIIYIIFSFSVQGVEAYGKLEKFVNSDSAAKLLSVHTWKEYLSLLPYGSEILDKYSFDPKEILKGLMKGAITLTQSSISTVAGTGISFTINFSMMIIALWIFFFSGEDFLHYVLKISPLSQKQEIMIVDEFSSISKTTFVGTFGAATIQGIMGGVLLWFYGFSPLISGVAFAFASLIPIVGTSLVWGPIALFLIFTGSVASGIILIVLGASIGFSDNLLRPLLMKEGSEIHPGIMFFSIIGGLLAFGFFGMIYGPIIVAITKIVLDIYYEGYGARFHDGDI